MAVHGYTKNYKLIKPEFNSDTWHDYEYENLDIIDAVLSAIYASGQWRGFWKNDTLYHELDVVIDRNTDTMYKVVVEHTTDDNVTFAEYMFTHPEYYQLWSPNNLAKDWAIKDDGLADNQDYSAKAYAIGGVGNETNNAKYYSEQSAIQAEASARQAAASASSATASHNSEQLALSHAYQSASSAATSLAGAEQATASATLSQEQAELSQSHAEYAADEIAGLEAFTQEKQAEILASVNAALMSAEEAKRYAAAAQGGNIGDIGIAPFGIDESLNLRRYLNGQVISQSQFQSFNTKIKKAVELYPSLSATEENWQAEVTASVLGQCGKFVIDDTAGTIRLPKVVNINGLQDLALIGGIKAESLPNITGSFRGGNHISGTNESGAFYDQGGRGDSKSYSASHGREFLEIAFGFDASRSSSTYQDNAPVQQETVQYPYFIQVATGTEETLPAISEYKLNNPYFFGMSIWSEVTPNNASWLLSNGAFHSGYTDYYNWLLKIYNGTETVDGVSVKGVSDEYTDYDFVVNTADSTFRLPLDTKLASGKAVKGNGMTLGLTNGTQIGGLVQTGASGLSSLYVVDNQYGANVGTSEIAGGTVLDWQKSVGVTTDPDKSGIITASDGLKLYFYVGDTLQDAQLINAGRALNDIAELKGHAIVEEYHNGTDGYRIWSNGFIEQWGKTVRPISETEITVNFLIPFKDTDYIYVDSIQSDGFYAGVFNMCWVENTGRTTTSIKVWSSSDTSRNWFACGYIR